MRYIIPSYANEGPPMEHCVICGGATPDFVELRGCGPICRSHVGESPSLKAANERISRKKWVPSKQARAHHK